MIDTRVAIVGAGPAGLVLSHILHRAGIETVVLECRDRGYVESRVRAGVLEHGTVELLDHLGLAGRLHAEGLVHHGVNLQFHGVRHRIDFDRLTGKSITVYGQQEVVKDLIAARLEQDQPILFEAEATSIDGLAATFGSDRPVVRFRQGGRQHELRADVIAGCDGFHGISRRAIPAAGLRVYQREYPFAWLGVLAAVAPSTDELIYSHHQRGFAMHSLRSPTVSRLYLQVDPDEDIGAWPDDRIWSELQVRLGAPGWRLHEGPILEKGITPMRSFVADPLVWGRLFLAGDAAHIVPPTGAKGLNLAIADVAVLAGAVVRWFSDGDRGGLDAYSNLCLQRVWRVQEFSTMMTALLHVDRAEDGFGQRLQRARQEYLCGSEAMRKALADNYVGLPIAGLAADARKAPS